MLQSPEAPARILAVDDSPDNLFLVQTLLETQGYQIFLAEDGISALEQVEAIRPDLILLDVMMPGIDGYEVTRRIRRNQPRLGFIPILLITAYQQSSVVEGLDAGADDFIRKPIELEELLARVRALLRLKASIDEQDRMSRQREDFVSRLTHDLRTPLVAADRMMHLMQEEAFGPISPALQEALENMVRSNRNLLQMVNTILEVYRHEAGNKTLTFLPVDLQDLIQEVVEELAPLVPQETLKLSIDLGQLPPALKPPMVLGDRMELRRVLTNLLGNAIKFTEAGCITVRLRQGDCVSPDHPATHWLCLEVEDSGSGIPLEDQAHLFERFRQGEHKRAGSGLGLYLSRRIVEAHQGKIEVRSQPGVGSCFQVHLPMHLAREASP